MRSQSARGVCCGPDRSQLPFLVGKNAGRETMLMGSGTTGWKRAPRRLVLIALSGVVALSVVYLGSGEKIGSRGIAAGGLPTGTTAPAQVHLAASRHPRARKLGAGVRGRRSAAEPGRSCPWLNSRLSVSTRVDLLLRAMTPLQEAELLHLDWGPSGPDRYESQSAAIPALCIPVVTEQDGSAGVASGWGASPGEFSGVTQLPAPIADAAAFDPHLAGLYGSVIGAEDAGVGVDVALAPMVNIERDPLWGRAYESLGEDPYLSASLAVPIIEGIQAQRVGAVVKHFAAYNQETGRGTWRDNSLVSQRALHEIYLPAFAAAVRQAHPAGVMCAYDLIDGVPSCQDRPLLDGELRGVWGFTGFVRSDCGSIFDQAASIAAGVSQVKCTRLYQPAQLARAVGEGRMSRAILDGLVRPLLYELFRFNLIASPHPLRPYAWVSTAADQAVALQVANDSAVLLRNDGVLPLDLSHLGSLALIGPFGGSPATVGLGAMRDRTRLVVTALYALRAAVGNRLRYDNGADPARAARVARGASAAVVVVYDRESEGHDKTSLALSGNQDALVAAVEAANPRTIVVLETGAPVLMPWLDHSAAVLETWYPGQDAGLSLVDLLSGVVNPSGKLPVSWPASPTARPDALPSEFGGGGGPTHYSDGIDVGYRWYETTGVNPAFPFGYGLSYTTFRFSGLKVGTGADGTLVVSAVVTNTGGRAGAEVAQCYLGVPPATGEPPRQLRGFQRVQLAAGASATVQFTLTPGDLATWDGSTGTWTVTPGEYRIYVGDASDSASLPLQAAITLPGANLGPDSGPAPTPGATLADSATPPAGRLIARQ